MDKITYLKGDATQPIGDDNKIIAHVVNNQGAWGAGFTKALDGRWPKARLDYNIWWSSQSKTPPHDTAGFNLGNVRYSLVGREPQGSLQWVAHMQAQQGLIGRGNPRPLRYDALGACLHKVGMMALEVDATVHMPRIGCGLAGGDWNIVGLLINEALCRQRVDVFVYDLDQ